MALREAVAVDFMGVGAGGSPPDGGSEERGRVVRPIPSGGHARSPAPEGSHPFPSQGLQGEFSFRWKRSGFLTLTFP